MTFPQIPHIFHNCLRAVSCSELLCLPTVIISNMISTRVGPTMLHITLLHVYIFSMGHGAFDHMTRRWQMLFDILQSYLVFYSYPCDIVPSAFLVKFHAIKMHNRYTFMFVSYFGWARAHLLYLV